jgi:glycosyltransferase involved in cell wall biosynthesis
MHGTHGRSLVSVSSVCSVVGGSSILVPGFESMEARNCGVRDTGKATFASPLVSVIIPVYNRAWCIRRAVESVLAQDYRPLELIVVDDGSSDDTPAVLDSIAREYDARPKDGATEIALRVLRQDNRGVSAARNLGIRNANGSWIALLDSDDEWLPQKTSRQIADLLSHPGMRIHQTGETWIRRGRRVNPPDRLRKKAGDLFEQCLDHCAISPSAVMLRHEVLDKVGLFDETYPACEDYEMWLRITCRYEIGLLGENLIVKHGGHADQLSFTVEALDRYRIQAIVKTLDSGVLDATQRKAALQALDAKCRIYTQGCRKRGRDHEALEILGLVADHRHHPD